MLLATVRAETTSKRPMQKQNQSIDEMNLPIQSTAGQNHGFPGRDAGYGCMRRPAIARV
ncbi:hypothetical protein [Caballeronia sp. RCC_10]|uniref:hypothetical protein n=1 Tax=Caballeronia sp. RCC_10 TaxID=3239227 RepID=UPI0035266F15